jgi:hypothetical protein
MLVTNLVFVAKYSPSTCLVSTLIYVYNYMLTYIYDLKL